MRSANRMDPVRGCRHTCKPKSMAQLRLAQGDMRDNRAHKGGRSNWDTIDLEDTLGYRHPRQRPASILA